MPDVNLRSNTGFTQLTRNKEVTHLHQVLQLIRDGGTLGGPCGARLQHSDCMHHAAMQLASKRVLARGQLRVQTSDRTELNDFGACHRRVCNLLVSRDTDSACIMLVALTGQQPVTCSDSEVGTDTSLHRCLHV